MLAHYYHTYLDINENRRVSWDAFSISISNIENVIYDMLKEVNHTLKSKSLIAVMVWDYKVWDTRQDYDIYDIVDWYSDENYLNNWKVVWYWAIQIKEA